MPDLTDLVTLLTSLKASLDTLQLQLADALVAAKSAYDKGFADGVASVPVSPSGPTQADLDAANAKVDALQAVVDGFPAEKAQAVSEALLALKEAAKQLVDDFEESETLSANEVKTKIDAL